MPGPSAFHYKQKVDKTITQSTGPLAYSSLATPLSSNSPPQNYHDRVIGVGSMQPQRVLQYLLDVVVALLHLHRPPLAVTADLLAVLG